MLKIEIKTGGSAFHCEEPEENPALDKECMCSEVSRLLKKVGKQIADGECYGVIMDLNGNKVGEWSLE